MLCFPLDNTEYTAKALGAFTGTRTRGVFSDENNLAVLANNDMSVTVKSGLAWLKRDAYWGTCALQESDLILPIELADTRYTRYDAICCRLDKNANKAEIVVKTGQMVPNASYVPIVRNQSYDELYLAIVEVTPGSIAVQPRDIQDTRLNGSLCGVMRDGVTGIPTQQLYEMAVDKLIAIDEMREEQKEDFLVWFNYLKGILGEDVAAQLLDKINKKLVVIAPGGPHPSDTDPNAFFIEALDTAGTVDNSIYILPNILAELV